MFTLKKLINDYFLLFNKILIIIAVILLFVSSLSRADAIPVITPQPAKTKTTEQVQSQSSDSTASVTQYLTTNQPNIEQLDIQKTINSKTQSNNDTGTAYLLNKINDMEQMILELRGKIEEQNHAMNQMEKENRDRYIDLDQRIRELNNKKEESSHEPISSHTQLH